MKFQIVGFLPRPMIVLTYVGHCIIFVVFYPKSSLNLTDCWPERAITLYIIVEQYLGTRPFPFGTK